MLDTKDPIVDESEAWVLQDTRDVVGNSALWWAKDCKGYCCDLERAHWFTREDAIDHERRRSTDLAWPLAMARRATETHARVEQLSRLDDERRVVAGLQTAERERNTFRAR